MLLFCVIFFAVAANEAWDTQNGEFPAIRSGEIWPGQPWRL